MATKNSTSNPKKSGTKKAPTVKKATNTKITTVKAVSTKEKMTPALFNRGKSLNKAPLIGAGIAELIGAFLLTAAFISGQGQPIIVLFAIVGIFLAIGALSGAHLNPLVTVGAWATRRIKSVRAAAYIVAQVLGAALALTVLNGFIEAAPAVSEQAAAFGQTAPALFEANPIPEGKETAVLFAELIGATIFAFAFASALRQKDRLVGAMTVGFGLFTALLISGSAAAAVGASTILNPAIAVALQAINFDSAWPVAIYILVAMLGGIIGFLLQDLLSDQSDGGSDQITV